MAKIKNYEQFIVDIADKNFKSYVKRFQELAGLRPLGQTSPATYLIEVTVDFGDSLQEHKTIQNFKKTTNRYYYHPEETNPPVKAHYHDWDNWRRHRKSKCWKRFRQTQYKIKD